MKFQQMPPSPALGFGEMRIVYNSQRTLSETTGDLTSVSHSQAKITMADLYESFVYAVVAVVLSAI